MPVVASSSSLQTSTLCASFEERARLSIGAGVMKPAWPRIVLNSVPSRPSRRTALHQVDVDGLAPVMRKCKCDAPVHDRAASPAELTVLGTRTNQTYYRNVVCYQQPASLSRYQASSVPIRRQPRRAFRINYLTSIPTRWASSRVGCTAGTRLRERSNRHPERGGS